MKVFYKSNPGLSSRVAHHIDFPDYNRSELLLIAQKLFQERQYRMTFYAEEIFLRYLDLRRQLPLFANARSVKNIASRACFRLASRVMRQNDVFTYKSLVDITPRDLILSTLFAKGMKIYKLTKAKNAAEKINYYTYPNLNNSTTSKTSNSNHIMFTWKKFC
jgi:hypothetical protein